MSRKPSVMMSAVLAPVRSRIVFIATVDPCRNNPAEAYAVPAFSTATEMPSTRRCGVDNALPSLSLPVAASNAATSVKVPPISAARRNLGRPAEDRDWFGGFIGRAELDFRLAPGRRAASPLQRTGQGGNQLSDANYPNT